MPTYAHGRVATLALLAVTLIWGSSFVLTKWALDQIDPLDFLFWRFVIATSALVLIRPRAVAELSPLARRRGVVIGLFLGAGFVAQTYGLQTTSPAVSGFLTGMMIVLTPLLAALFFRRRIEPLAWAGVLLATAGLAVISLRGLSLGIGEALTLLGALLFAGQIALLSEWPRPDEAFGTTVLQCATATAVAGLPALLTGGIAAPPNAGVWGALLLMGLGAGAIGFTVQAWAQAHLTATRAAIIMAMEPVFAGMFAVLYGEALTLRLVVGGSLVLAAILLVELGPRHSREGQVPRVQG